MPKRKAPEHRTIEEVSEWLGNVFLPYLMERIEIEAEELAERDHLLSPQALD